MAYPPSTESGGSNTDTPRHPFVPSATFEYCSDWRIFMPDLTGLSATASGGNNRSLVGVVLWERLRHHADGTLKAFPCIRFKRWQLHWLAAGRLRLFHRPPFRYAIPYVARDKFLELCYASSVKRLSIFCVENLCFFNVSATEEKQLHYIRYP
jgi:hypothetical protein